ncbi:MAG: DUF4350 domain-containing protein [Pyrinomonadaceae bacterium]|nr:DUF4350 domain-containing protein [Pyrinomonadaceae bacterium]
MKQKFLIVLALIFLVALLIGLNAASYVQKDTEADEESSANRSTFNTGATGTRAFYDLLAETGSKVTRWQESPFELSNEKNKINTLVIIGRTRLEIDETETEQILSWVSNGGRLVIIDREPPKDLLSTTANWSITSVPNEDSTFGVDPSEIIQMTGGTAAIKPSQPSVFTRNVNAVQPSRFASSIDLKFFGEDAKTTFGLSSGPTPKPVVVARNDAPPPVAKPTNSPAASITPIYKLPPPKTITESAVKPPPIESENFEVNAPFVHLANDKKTILVDFEYGAGQIVFLSDPYIVSNAGISLVDNAQLAMNIATSREGLIAFDEYHQGYGANTNQLLKYFAGTPVLAIIGQILLLIGVVLFSQSRRFARFLPADEPNRLSKLEYISAMAELQQRTKAFDLALENIFSQFRRSVTRFFGIDNYASSRKELAKIIAERLNRNELEIYNLMRKCEEIIQGKPTNKREVLELSGKLREIEDKLGLKRTRKQAFRSKK